jgi:ABC-type sulfate/molybdate transport systems ATPase subunit
LSLLSVEHATKRYRRGRLERVAVRDVSLHVEQGELVAVWGARFSGRSTLLRLAAGIELPEEGRVVFEGRDLAHSRNDVLGRRIGYWHASLAASQHGFVVDQVAASLLAQRALPKQARRRGQELLFRAGVEHCARLQCHELDGAEAVRVAIASALATGPAMLVIDEPTSGVDLLERDPLLSLLRSIANEGTAVLISTGDAQGLSGVDRALSMDGGELRGEVPRPDADVVQLRRAESGARRW